MAGTLCWYEKVTKFEQQYTGKNALYWYTSEPFIYDALNKALPTWFSPFLQLFEFFIRDIHAELTVLYQSCSERGIIHPYRGQAMSCSELDDLSTRINEILSMNSFLSTSRDRAIEYIIICLACLCRKWEKRRKHFSRWEKRLQLSLRLKYLRNR